MIQKKFKKSSSKYICNKCDYYTNRKSQYDRHLQTKKHNDTNGSFNDTKKVPYICQCGKTYKYHTGLSRHKKKCTYGNSYENPECSETNIDNVDLKEMVMELLQSNKELQDTIIQQQSQLIELAKEPKTMIKTQNNNTFNLNNFLNVDCKDAMNLSDFLDTILYTFKDLVHLGEQGFVKSLQNTFVKQLGDMEQTRRPIHCTDKKRKTIYVKDEDKWEKDNGNEKIASAIKTINKKQLAAFSKHSRERPEDYLDSDHNAYTQNNIIQQMCGYTKDTCSEINEKILKNLSSRVQIHK